MKMRTDLSRVRGLGAAHDGTGHFWHQRLSGISNAILLTAFVILLVVLHDGTYADVRAAFANPFVGLVMALTIVSATFHMRLGMQVIIEDYIHGHLRVPLQILNTFFAILVAAVSLIAIGRLTFGA
ncbi:succinate dehydrogenase, hydrophobic membrane anchor protein [Aureimonas psammosilenae]|uniref:succinate dehydrogenase, hydrophobic membrane anchor protein n=1 Tax=Aureimonas psammosilenae TaxID=2495496 RepID=UPI0012611864|nr:succinate dehydrogenase, hydrophobic membrane anchor protein [Aureimonas psammosilenae]